MSAPVSYFGDDKNQLLGRSRLDDAMVEAILSERQVPADLEPLADFVRRLRAIAEQPAPLVPPRTELANLMMGGVSAKRPETVVPAGQATGSGQVGPTLPSRRRSTSATRAPTVVVAVSVMALIAVGVAGVTAAVTGVLPQPVHQGFGAVVEKLTPFELPEQTNDTSGIGQLGGGGVDDAEDAGGINDRAISDSAHNGGADKSAREPDEPRPADTGPSRKPANTHAATPADVPTGPPESTPPKEPPHNGPTGSAERPVGLPAEAHKPSSRPAAKKIHPTPAPPPSGSSVPRPTHASSRVPSPPLDDGDTCITPPARHATLPTPLRCR